MTVLFTPEFYDISGLLSAEESMKVADILMDPPRGVSPLSSSEYRKSGVSRGCDLCQRRSAASSLEGRVA